MWRHFVFSLLPSELRANFVQSPPVKAGQEQSSDEEDESSQTPVLAEGNVAFANTRDRARTCDLRITKPLDDSVTNCETPASDDSLSGPSSSPSSSVHDSDLGTVIDTWPMLNDSVKDCILAIVNSTSENQR